MMGGATANPFPSKEGLLIVERYDTAFLYLYPQVQNFARSHGRFRDAMLDVMLRVPGEIYLAAKVGQVSKLNTLDATLAELRWCLRFASNPKVKLITTHQQGHAESLLAEVGGMVNAWKAKLKK